MKKRMICYIMLGILLTGCGKTESTTKVIGEDSLENPTVEEQQVTEVVDEKEPEVNEEITLKEVEEYEMSNDFSTDLMNYLETAGYDKENYMVSPTSYREAVALAIAGANGETKETMLKALGFKDEEEMKAWYKNVDELEKYFLTQKEWVQKEYEEYMDGYECVADNWNFSVLNSVWNNKDLSKGFTDEYLKIIKKDYDAEAHESSASEITEDINNWVDENTNGMIPQLLEDASEHSAVLVNTVYLKTAFKDEFSKEATTEKDFNTVNGDITKKEFMIKQDSMTYYEDAKSQLIKLPMEGGISLVVTLGESTPESVLENLKKADYCEVHVELPKIDTETTLGNKELVDYMKANGAEVAFTDDADFSIMCEDEKYKIDDIIQKTKIKLDEDGVEASAATAVLMVAEGAAMMEEPEEPKQFIADKPFKYYILAEDYDGHGELLFFGQIVE